MACRISSRERKRIKNLRERKKYSRRKIGEILGRDHTVVMKEYKRNKKR
jgi:IS30 family transposase